MEKDLEKILNGIRSGKVKEGELNLAGFELTDKDLITLIEAFPEDHNFTHIYLGGNKIGNKGVVALFEKLQNNTTVKGLDISNNDIDDDEKVARALNELLKNNKTLKVLDIAENKTGDTTTTAIEKGLEDNTSITCIKLTGNRMIWVEKRRTFKRTLENIKSGKVKEGELDLTDLNLTDEDVIALAKAIPEDHKFTHIYLGGNKIGNKGVVALFKKLENNTTVKILDISENNIDDDDEEATQALNELIGKNKAFEEIDLRNNNIAAINEHNKEKSKRDSRLNSKIKFRNQEKINLFLKQIESRKIGPKLNSTGFELTDEDVITLTKVIPEDHKFTHIHLDDNNIGNKGIIALFKKLANNTTVKVLDISNNNIDDDKAVAQALNELLKNNKTLERLEIKNNIIGYEIAKVLAIYKAKNENLEIVLSPESEAILRQQQFKNLLGDIQSKKIKTKTLNLTGWGLTERNAKALAKAIPNDHNFTHIFINKNNIRAGGATALFKRFKNDKTLEVLDISNNNINDNILTAEALEDLLEQNETLKSLNIKRNIDLNHTVAKSIANSRKGNQKLEIHYSRHLRKKIEKRIKFKEILEHIKNGTLKPEDLEDGVLNLDNFELTNEDVEKLIEAIPAHPNFTGLSLRNNNIGSYGAVAILRKLKNDTTIKSLNISNCKIQDDSIAEPLLDLFKENTVLKSLDISNNMLGEKVANAISLGKEKNTILKIICSSDLTTAVEDCEKARDENVKSFNELLKGIKNGTLGPEYLEKGVLTLDEIKFTSKQVNDIADAIPDNPNFIGISLRCSNIDNKGAIAIINKIKDNKVIETLDLSGNSINGEDEEVQSALETLLKKNEILKKLDISDNTIGNKAVERIAESLKENTSLIFLGLENTDIEDTGAKALGDMLKENSTLEELNLKSNLIEDEGAKGISEGLKANQGLKKLNLSLNKITEEGAAHIGGMLESNTYLKELDIGHNQISRKKNPKWITAITDSLKKNKTLIKLNLNFALIEDKEAEAIGKMLKINTSLEFLSLRFCSQSHVTGQVKISKIKNGIQEKGAEVLAGGIKNNTALKELVLIGHDIRDAGAEALIDALKNNTTLEKLSISDTRIQNKKLREEIRKMNKHNGNRLKKRQNNKEENGNLIESFISNIKSQKDELIKKISSRSKTGMVNGKVKNHSHAGSKSTSLIMMSKRITDIGKDIGNDKGMRKLKKLFINAFIGGKRTILKKRNLGNLKNLRKQKVKTKSLIRF